MFWILVSNCQDCFRHSIWNWGNPILDSKIQNNGTMEHCTAESGFLYCSIFVGMSLLIKFFTWILSSGASVIYKYFQRTLYQHSFLWLSFTKALQIVIQWLVWLFINFHHLVHQMFFYYQPQYSGICEKGFITYFKSSLIFPKFQKISEAIFVWLKFSQKANDLFS